MSNKKQNNNKKSHAVSRRLPSGKITRDLDSYVRAWKRAARAISKATGWTLIGFDPGFLYDTDGYNSLSLTTGQARALTKAINKKK